LSTFWSRYTAEFPIARTVGFSLPADNNFEVVSQRIRTARIIFGSTPPRSLQLHIYGGPTYPTETILRDAVNALRSPENVSLRNLPIIIGETYYNDPQTANELRDAIQDLAVNVSYILQWPLERSRPQICNSGGDPFEFCAVPPPYRFGSYLQQGF
jgi:hypothetical protein